MNDETPDPHDNPEIMRHRRESWVDGYRQATGDVQSWTVLLPAIPGELLKEKLERNADRYAEMMEVAPQIDEAIAEAKAGKTIDRGDFSQFLSEEEKSMMADELWGATESEEAAILSAWESTALVHANPELEAALKRDTESKIIAAERAIQTLDLTIDELEEVEEYVRKLTIRKIKVQTYERASERIKLHVHSDHAPEDCAPCSMTLVLADVVHHMGDDDR